MIWFLRPTLIVAICFLLAFLVSNLLSQHRENATDNELDDLHRLATDFRGLQIPSPTLGPKQVAEIQAAALRDPDRKRGTLQCMNFASPANLEVTGPVENFSRIIRGQKFYALSNHVVSIAGTPVFRGGNARVLVTVLSKDRPSAYVWVLAKQAEGPFADCWMTDGVFPIANAEDSSPEEI